MTEVCAVCESRERERAPLVCKEPVENKPHINADTHTLAQMQRERLTVRPFVRQEAKMVKT